MSSMTPDETLDDPAESKPKMPLSRMLLLLVLLVAVVTLFLDLRARWSADAACATLEELVDSGDEDKTPDVIQELVGKVPDADPGYKLDSYEVEVYTWPGVIRSYSVHVGYKKGNVQLLEKVSLNVPLDERKK